MSATNNYIPPPLSTQSPQKLTAGATMNWAPSFVGSSEKSRDALRLDLDRRVEYNIDILSTFLRVGDIKDDIVNRCINKIYASDSYDQYHKVITEKRSGARKYTEQNTYVSLVSNHSTKPLGILVYLSL
jgi:hypothetical protein